MAYYVFDEKLCKTEGMTKEQIINAIAEATGTTPSDVDQGFISTLIENNRSRSIHVWKGTRAEYNALESKSFDTLYIIDDDTTIADFEAAVTATAEAVQELAEDVQEIESEIADSGWKLILRENLNNVSVSVGQYRIMGKMAFVTLHYNPDDFTANTQSDDFVLPIKLDLRTRTNIAIPYYTNTNPITVYMACGFLTTDSETGKTAFQYISNQDVEEVRIAFSYPLADEN